MPYDSTRNPPPTFPPVRIPAQFPTKVPGLRKAPTVVCITISDDPATSAGGFLACWAAPSSCKPTNRRSSWRRNRSEPSATGRDRSAPWSPRISTAPCSASFGGGRWLFFAVLSGGCL